MDFNALQHKLFEMDPTDPAEDLRKLAAQANGSGADVPPAKDYVAESVEVPQGSMPLGIDSVADFAALAGVRIDEKQKDGDYARGSDPMPKAEPGRTKHPLKDKLVGETDIEEGPMDSLKHGFKNYNTIGAVTGAADKMSDGPKPVKQTSGATQQTQKTKGSVTGPQLAKQLGVSDPQVFLQAVQKVRQGQPLSRMHQAAFSEAFQKLMAMDPQSTQKVMMMLKRMEATSEAQEMPKSRDPNSKTMQGIRSSGAAGAHKDKKKVLPRKEKHKGKAPMESIKDMLYRKLAEKK